MPTTRRDASSWQSRRRRQDSKPAGFTHWHIQEERVRPLLLLLYTYGARTALSRTGANQIQNHSGPRNVRPLLRTAMSYENLRPCVSKFDINVKFCRIKFLSKFDTAGDRRENLIFSQNYVIIKVERKIPPRCTKNTPYHFGTGCSYQLSWRGCRRVLTPRLLPRRLRERKPSGCPSWEPLPQTELPCPRQRADGEERKPWE